MEFRYRAGEVQQIRRNMFLSTQLVERSEVPAHLWMPELETDQANEGYSKYLLKVYQKHPMMRLRYSPVNIDGTKDI
jgi:hypothetical protein